MKIGDIVKHKGDTEMLGLVLGFKEVHGLLNPAVWVYWSDGIISWSTKNRLKIIIS